MRRFFMIFAINCMQISMIAVAQGETPENQVENQWVSRPYAVAFRGFPIHKSELNVPYRGEVLYTTSQTETGLVFMCISGKLLVTAAIEPTDLSSIFGNYSTRGKYQSGKLIINGEVADRGQWLYRPTLKLIGPNRKKTKSVAQKIYNAVIRQDKVEIKRSSKSPVEIVLPKPNSAFADFGSECGIGRNK